MDSSLSESSQSVIVGDDLEEFEVTEMDGALLRDLLEESTENDRVGCAVQSLEVKNDHKVMMVGQDCLEQDVSPIGHDFDWLDMMEMEMEMAQPLPSDEMIVWYVNGMVGMVDFGYNGDYSDFYNGVSLDETAYSCLWEDS